MNSKIRASRDILSFFIIEFNIIFFVCIRGGGARGGHKRLLKYRYQYSEFTDKN